MIEKNVHGWRIHWATERDTGTCLVCGRVVGALTRKVLVSCDDFMLTTIAHRRCLRIKDSAETPENITMEYIPRTGRHKVA